MGPARVGRGVWRRHQAEARTAAPSHQAWLRYLGWPKPVRLPANGGACGLCCLLPRPASLPSPCGPGLVDRQTAGRAKAREQAGRNPASTRTYRSDKKILNSIRNGSVVSRFSSSTSYIKGCCGDWGTGHTSHLSLPAFHDVAPKAPLCSSGLVLSCASKESCTHRRRSAWSLLGGQLGALPH